MWKIEQFRHWQVGKPVKGYLDQISDEWALIRRKRSTCVCAQERRGASGPLHGLRRGTCRRRSPGPDVRAE